MEQENTMSETTKRIKKLSDRIHNKMELAFILDKPYTKDEWWLELATHLHQEVIKGKIDASEKAHKQYLMEHTKVDLIPFEELHKMVYANIESDKALYKAEAKLAELEQQIRRE